MNKKILNLIIIFCLFVLLVPHISALNNKYIEDVVVRKKFKGVVELEIIEYGIVAKNVDNMVIISSGDVLENNYSIDDIPRLVSNLDDGMIKEFASKFRKIDGNVLRDISEIEYSPILVDADRFLLYMNDGNFVYVTLTKVDKMNKYNDIKDELMGKKGIIYLDSGDYVELKGQLTFLFFWLKQIDFEGGGCYN